MLHGVEQWEVLALRATTIRQELSYTATLEAYLPVMEARRLAAPGRQQLVEVWDEEFGALVEALGNESQLAQQLDLPAQEAAATADEISLLRLILGRLLYTIARIVQAAQPRLLRRGLANSKRSRV